METYPPTILVIHEKEKRTKCTVEPLRSRSGFVFVDYPMVDESIALDGYVRLGLEGPLLSRDDAALGLLVIDGTWRLASKMVSSFSHCPPRSLPPARTAYPRVSKMNADPAQGLATIEALWLAYHVLGRSTEGLLDAYRWADSFRERNPEYFLEPELRRAPRA